MRDAFKRAKGAVVGATYLVSCFAIGGGMWLASGCLVGARWRKVPTCAGTSTETMGWLCIAIGIAVIVALWKPISQTLAPAAAEAIPPGPLERQ